MPVSDNPYESVLEVRPADLVPSPTGPPSSLLAKTPVLEVRRLVLARGRAIPTHHAKGEITVHCLEGRITFTAGDHDHDLKAGQLLILPAGQPHALVGLEDAVVLVTKVLN
jgi:quercetin dioxygenase-like cupin family protein